ncbi:MAG: sulfate adenylyltransferase [Deltaproteobacteria bacterium]|nr:sulfate adenylyltransferase [Deltaproteobacteria bacterium]
MIKPYGSDKLKPLIVDNEKLLAEKLKEAEGLPSIIINSAAAANAVMMGAGYFTPLDGFMNKDETLSVAENLKLPNGLFWPVPIVNMAKNESLTDEIRKAKRIALLDPNVPGNPVIAIQEVDSIDKLDPDFFLHILERIYKTADFEHPGVFNFLSSGCNLISGKIEVLNYSYFQAEFPDTFRTAVEIRDLINQNKWEKIVAFQTRNPMHRAHEELCKMALKMVKADGVLIHMLLGKLKKGDIPADVRNRSIRKMVELYFPKDTVLVTGYGFDMLYAGPREALLHALFRQNAGCTHLIIGRDHAGVGDYYGAFDAQTIFDEIPKNALDIQIFRGDHTVWCKKCEEVVMMRDCPHDREDYLLLSGTKVRNMLAHGEPLPPEFSRPEVAEILSGYYKSELDQ